MQHNGGTCVYPVCVTSASLGAPGLNSPILSSFSQKKHKTQKTQKPQPPRYSTLSNKYATTWYILLQFFYISGSIWNTRKWVAFFVCNRFFFFFCALGNISRHLLTGKLLFLKELFCPLSLKENSLLLGNNTWADKKDFASGLWASLAQAAACDKVELKPVLLQAWDLVHGWTPSRAALPSNPISHFPEDRHTMWGLEQFPNPAKLGRGFHSSLTQWPPVFPVPAKKCTLNCIIRKIKPGLFNLPSISPEFIA